jgi:hypothetical protein
MGNYIMCLYETVKDEEAANDGLPSATGAAFNIFLFGY